MLLKATLHAAIRFSLAVALALSFYCVPVIGNPLRAIACRLTFGLLCGDNLRSRLEPHLRFYDPKRGSREVDKLVRSLTRSQRRRIESALGRDFLIIREDNFALFQRAVREMKNKIDAQSAQGTQLPKNAIQTEIRSALQHWARRSEVDRLYENY